MYIQQGAFHISKEVFFYCQQQQQHLSIPSLTFVRRKLLSYASIFFGILLIKWDDSIK
jgi:hypothetical protein